MNLMVISDYGVAEMDDKEDVLLEDYLDLDDVQHIVYTPGYVAITPFALRHDKVIEIRATFAWHIFPNAQVTSNKNAHNFQHHFQAQFT